MTGAEPVHIVTGAAGDIALATIPGLPEGIVLASDANPERLESRVASLRQAGRVVVTHACDITRSSDCDGLLQRAREVGRPASLIHCAGVSPPSDPALIYAVNLLGTANMLDACEAAEVRDFVAVCIASLAGHRARAAHFDELLDLAPAELRARAECLAPDVSPSRLAYAVSKRAVLQQVRARAASWGISGNRIVSVSPGIVTDTAMGSARKSTAQHGARAALQREASAADIAAAISFAAGAQASFISGIDILVDGGFLALVNTALPDDQREAWHDILA